jgi:hypothetical protein
MNISLKLVTMQVSIGIISCCSSLVWRVDFVYKLELSTATRTTLWLSGLRKLLPGTLKTGQRDLIEHGITSVYN